MSALLSTRRAGVGKPSLHPIIDGNRRMREMRQQALWMLALMAALMGTATLSALIYLVVRS